MNTKIDVLRIVIGKDNLHVIARKLLQERDGFRYPYLLYGLSVVKSGAGPHPVMVSGWGISPGWQLHLALPIELTVQVVPGPHGDGWQGFLGGLDK